MDSLEDRFEDSDYESFRSKVNSIVGHEFFEIDWASGCLTWSESASVEFPDYDFPMFTSFTPFRVLTYDPIPEVILDRTQSSDTPIRIKYDNDGLPEKAIITFPKTIPDENRVEEDTYQLIIKKYAPEGILEEDKIATVILVRSALEMQIERAGVRMNHLFTTIGNILKVWIVEVEKAHGEDEHDFIGLNTGLIFFTFLMGYFDFDQLPGKHLLPELAEIQSSGVRYYLDEIRQIAHEVHPFE